MVAINRKVIRIALIIMLVLVIVAHLVGPLIGGPFIFKFDQPGSLAIWFESFLYLVNAILLTLLALGQDQQKSNSWRWGFFALFMLFLSVNATIEFNNRLAIYTLPIGINVFNLLLYCLLAVALIVILWPVLRAMPERFRLMLFFSGILFGLGTIVVDNLSNLLFHGYNIWFYLIKKLLEFTGILILIDTLVAYLAYQSSPTSLVYQDDSIEKPEGGN